MSPTKEKSTNKKKYCRKKKVVRHANPLFEKWLIEWEKEADDLGSNMKFNYRRARVSLKLYPLPVYRGEDCKVLANFGDKMCQMLDRRLQKHVDENGPVNWDELHQIIGTPATKKRTRKKTEKKNVPAAGRKESDNILVANATVTGSGGRGRPYIPSFRSGGYALLVALYNNSRENDCDFMKKTQLMEAAQPHCNASFTQASDGSHYTAWSSMSTLIKKSLITREGNPSRYTITADGKSLAMKLLSADHSDLPTSSNAPAKTNDDLVDIVTLSSRSCSPFSLSGSPVKNCRLNDPVSIGPTFSHTVKSKTQKSDAIKGSKNVKKRKNSPSDLMAGSKRSGNPALMNSSQNDSGSLIFSYITSLEMETPLKDKAVVSVEDDGFLGFLVKCRLSALLNSNLSYRVDDSRTAPLGFTYAYLSNECAPNTSPGLLSPAQKLPVSSRRLDPAARIPFGTCFSPSKDDNSTETAIDLISSKKHYSGSTASSKSSVSLLQKIASGSSIPKSVESVSSVKRFGMEPPISPHTPFFLLAGIYEIVLCVDNCETTGGNLGASKFNTKDIIINELQKHKVTYDVRKLHVGDFLWIVRERTSMLKSTDQPKELVLPYIVERKRMDDLASSIRDGRFKEQKFRLKQCGLSKPIYLVEEYGSKNLSLPESTCLQAVTNTQVVDGFTVKITKDQQESAAFLTIMTRCLQSRYQGKSVRSLTMEDLQSQEEMTRSNAVETALMTFTDFNTSSMKNHQLPVKEMFAKHLLQLHGLSVDKAKAVVEKYGTPASLIAMYEELQNPMESEQILASLRGGKTGRNLGPALSLNVAKLYTNLMLK